MFAEFVDISVVPTFNLAINHLNGYTGEYSEPVAGLVGCRKRLVSQHRKNRAS